MDKQTRKHHVEELNAELDRLRTENAALRKGALAGIRLKVSDRGAVWSTAWGASP